MLVLSAVHHRRVLPLMSRPLRMDEMGSGVSSHDLEACRMSNEAPADEEVAARVRSAVAGDFQLEHVNGYPMKIDKGSINLVSSSYCRYSVSDLSDPPWHSCLLVQGSIDARSSKPPIKEDGVDRERRRESVEKQKYAKDLEKKKKEKKRILSGKRSRNTARNRGKGGSPRRTPVTRMTRMRATMTATTLRGWQLALTESSRARCEPTSTCHGRGSPRGH